MSRHGEHHLAVGHDEGICAIAIVGDFVGLRTGAALQFHVVKDIILHERVTEGHRGALAIIALLRSLQTAEDATARVNGHVVIGIITREVHTHIVLGHLEAPAIVRCDVPCFDALTIAVFLDNHVANDQLGIIERHMHINGLFLALLVLARILTDHVVQRNRAILILTNRDVVQFILKVGHQTSVLGGHHTVKL